MVDHRAEAETASGPGQPTDFYAELDARKRQAGRSCCTLWTLGLLLIATLTVGLWLIF